MLRHGNKLVHNEQIRRRLRHGDHHHKLIYVRKRRPHEGVFPFVNGVDIALFVRQNGYSNSVAHERRLLPLAKNASGAAFVGHLAAEHIIKSARRLNDKSLLFGEGLIFIFVEISFIGHSSSAISVRTRRNCR